MTADAPMRVLLVDDDEIDRMVVKRALKGTGLDVWLQEAGNGDQALEAVAADHRAFDCVLLDYRLPGDDGVEVLQQLRQRGVQVPVIMLTGMSDAQRVREMFEAGASLCVMKDDLMSERLGQCLQYAWALERGEAVPKLFELVAHELHALLGTEQVLVLCGDGGSGAQVAARTGSGPQEPWIEPVWSQLQEAADRVLKLEPTDLQRLVLNDSLEFPQVVAARFGVGEQRGALLAVEHGPQPIESTRTAILKAVAEQLDRIFGRDLGAAGRGAGNGGLGLGGAAGGDDDHDEKEYSDKMDGAAANAASDASVERELAEADQDFRPLLNLFQDLGVLVWEMDVESLRYRYISDGHETFGYPRPQWYEDGFWTERLLHEDEREEIIAQRRRRSKGSSSHECVYRVRRADGAVRWVRDIVRVVGVEEQRGERRLLRGVMVDTTQQRAAEEEARRARYWNDLLLSSVGEGIYGLDVEGRTTFINEVATRLLGWTPGELIGRSQHEVIHHTRADGTHYPTEECPIFATCQRGEVHRVGGEVFWRKDGRSFPVDYTSTPIREGGEVLGAVVTFRDVSERVEAEQQLRAREKQLSDAQKMASIGSWEWDIPTDQVVWSEELNEIFGLAPGSPIDLERYQSMLHEEDRERVLATVQRAVEQAEGYDIWHRIVRLNGEERFIHSRGEIIADEEGRTVKLVGVAQDVTQQKRMEERAVTLAREQAARAEVERERERLYRVFQDLPAAIAISYGPEHVFQMVNPVYKGLVNGRELVGRSVREAFPELEDQAFFHLLDEVYRTGEPFRGREMRVLYDRDNDGQMEEAFFNFVYQPMMSAGDEVYGIMVHAVEVTDMVRARQEIEGRAVEFAQLSRELERSNADLDQFAYITSHDLKAPLRGLASVCQWLEGGSGGTPGGGHQPVHRPAAQPGGSDGGADQWHPAVLPRWALWARTRGDRTLGHDRRGPGDARSAPTLHVRNCPLAACARLRAHALAAGLSQPHRQRHQAR